MTKKLAMKAAENSKGFKRYCLSPYQGIYNILGQIRKQSKITVFLKILEGELNINASSESLDDIIQPKKRSHLIELSSNDEEHCKTKFIIYIHIYLWRFLFVFYVFKWIYIYSFLYLIRFLFILLFLIAIKILLRR